MFWVFDDMFRLVPTLIIFATIFALKFRIYNGREGQNFKAVQHWSRTSFLYFFLCLLFLFAGLVCMEYNLRVNINHIPSFETYVEQSIRAVKKFCARRVLEHGTPNANLSLVKFHLTEIDSLLKIWIQNINTIDSSTTIEIINQLKIHVVPILKAWFFFLNGTFFYKFMIYYAIAVKSIFVAPVLHFVYLLYFFGGIKSYTFVLLSVYFFYKRDFFIYDKE
jgi:hypothetical protein